MSSQSFHSAFKVRHSAFDVGRSAFSSLVINKHNRGRPTRFRSALIRRIRIACSTSLTKTFHRQFAGLWRLKNHFDCALGTIVRHDDFEFHFR